MCDKCLAELKIPESPLCVVCGRPLKSGGTDRKCGKCIENPPAFALARAAVIYGGSARKLIHALKYHEKIVAARFMGHMIASLISAEYGFLADTVLISVPLHVKKLGKRGFNQAAVIADAVRDSQKDFSGTFFEVRHDILERIVNTRTQAGLHKKQRLENVRGAFRVVHPEKISGRHAILVDDVFTTGATVSECASSLLKAGAARVSVVTFARVDDG